VPDFLFQERDLTASAVVRIPDEPIMGFEGGTGDRVHGTTAHAFEPDSCESTRRVHAVLSCYAGDA
jgi:hypothetical protein